MSALDSSLINETGMKGWVKCLRTIPNIFFKGDWYKVLDFPYPGKVILIDDTGSSIGFDTRDRNFAGFFRFYHSQKRGTKWAIQRQL
jgi:hypothetical protein